MYPLPLKWISPSLVIMGLTGLATAQSRQPTGKSRKLTDQKPVGFLWQATNRHSDQNHISVLFSCERQRSQTDRQRSQTDRQRSQTDRQRSQTDRQRSQTDRQRSQTDRQIQMSITLRDPGQPDHIKGLHGVVRLITNNTPPSGQGYKKFIYVSRFSKENKSLSLHKRDVLPFLEDLNTLHQQVLQNQKQGIKEYDEKIKYCESRPKKSRQKCFESSSGYQPRPPLIAIWIEADEAKRPAGRFNSLFDPKELDSLKKLPCHPAH